MTSPSTPPGHFLHSSHKAKCSSWTCSSWTVPWPQGLCTYFLLLESSPPSSFLLSFRCLFKCYLICESFWTTLYIIRKHSPYPCSDLFFPQLITVYHSICSLSHLFVSNTNSIKAGALLVILTAVSIFPNVWCMVGIEDKFNKWKNKCT